MLRELFVRVNRVIQVGVGTTPVFKSSHALAGTTPRRTRTRPHCPSPTMIWPRWPRTNGTRAEWRRLIGGGVCDGAVASRKSWYCLAIDWSGYQYISSMKFSPRVGVIAVVVGSALLAGAVGTVASTPAAASESIPVAPDQQPGMTIVGETNVPAGAGVDVLLTPTGPGTKINLMTALPSWLTFTDGRLTGTAPLTHGVHALLFWTSNQHAMLPAAVFLNVDGCSETLDPGVRSCTVLHEMIPFPSAMGYHRLYCPEGTYLARTSAPLSRGRLIPWGVHVDEHGQVGLGVSGERINHEWIERFNYYAVTGVGVDVTNYAFESRELTINLLCTNDHAKTERVR